MAEAPILALANFDKVFKMECGASHMGIGVERSQSSKPIAFISEKLNEMKNNYSTYDL